MSDPKKEINILEQMTKNLFSSDFFAQAKLKANLNNKVLPVVPIREGVLYPSCDSVLTFGRKLSVQPVQEALKKDRLIIIVSQKKPKLNTPQPADLYQVGTLALLERSYTHQKQLNVLAKGLARVKIVKYLKQDPLYAQVIELKNSYQDQVGSKALSKKLQELFHQAIQLGKKVEFVSFMRLVSNISFSDLADQVASTLNNKQAQKQKILEELDVKKRMQLVASDLSKEIEILKIEHDVLDKAETKMSKVMKERVLRERLEVIKKELGEFDDDQIVADEYGKKLKKISKFLDQKIINKIKKEIKKLTSMSSYNPESGYIRSWLETFFDLPWGKYSQQNINLKKAQKILNKNHHGLKDVKDRILELMAVMQLKTKHKKDSLMPTILCFVGPPGVGKTSIGKSVAEALGREFTKASLGGIRDEAEIRGHRRTYVGAMPGRIISGLKNAGSMNPVFMLDEIDKIGKDYKGDPSAALLEALDPEQNKDFEDHYLDMPFDLSQVLFITTANTLDSIPPALKDRLEVIHYAGYTPEEKLAIAKKHLVDKVLPNNGLKKTQLKFNNQALKFIIARYTREAGVRDLERNLNKIARKVAKEVVETDSVKTRLIASLPMIKKHLGPEKHDETFTEKSNQVGLATGLAWTSAGGDMLFVEVALSPGKGKVKLTGKLGEVMKESAQAAYTYVRSNYKKLKINLKKLEATDVHIHVPEGAVPKDGPSAGITITTAIISAFTNKKVNKNIAMTGEVTLRGRVLRIGGLKEKAIAAYRGGAKVIIIPAQNQRDLIEMPESVKKNIKFEPVEHMDQVLALALC